MRKQPWEVNPTIVMEQIRRPRNDGSLPVQRAFTSLMYELMHYRVKNADRHSLRHPVANYLIVANFVTLT